MDWNDYHKQLKTLKKYEKQLKVELSNIITKNEDYCCFTDNINFEDANIIIVISYNKGLKYSTLNKLIKYLNCKQCSIKCEYKFEKPYLIIIFKYNDYENKE